MKELEDDEIMDVAFQKLFGDLDGIRAGSPFEDEMEAPMPEGTVQGVAVEIKPITSEGAGEPEPFEGKETPAEELEEEEHLKELVGMSPIMAQLHGKR